VEREWEGYKKDLSHQSIRRSINNGLKHYIGFKMSSVFETCAI